MSGSLRERLKAATAGAHERLEQRLELACSARSLAEYVAYLGCMYHYYAAAEPGLQEHTRLRAAGIDMRRRAKLPWLEEDLSYFRMKRDTVEPPEAPVHRDSGLAEALGVAYVLEGATLGGAVLYARFERALALEKGRGASFLYGYGSETARMWKGFVERLNAASLSSSEERSCIAAARRTFASMGEWYEVYRSDAAQAAS